MGFILKSYDLIFKSVTAKLAVSAFVISALFAAVVWTLFAGSVQYGGEKWSATVAQLGLGTAIAIAGLFTIAFFIIWFILVYQLGNSVQTCTTSLLLVARPYIERMRTARLRSEDRYHFQHEGDDVVLEFGDLSVEANRIAYVEAMILDRVLPRFDAETYRLELAFLKLPRSTMNEVVATAAKLGKACGENAALLLEGFERRYVTQRGLEAIGSPT